MAEPTGTGPTQQQAPAEPNNQNTQQTSGATTTAIDYDKLATLISGKQKVTEDTVLKSYLKQQGLSGEELSQAINTFKSEKEKNTPDVAAIQNQVTQAQQLAQQAIIEKEATLEAISLGLDTKTIPYVLKMADMNGVIGEDGKVNQEALKAALTKVLEDVPQLKGESEETKGFHVGSTAAPNTGAQQNGQVNNTVGGASQKRWNRFN